jgi:hypothetical protein
MINFGCLKLEYRIVSVIIGTKVNYFLPKSKRNQDSLKLFVRI